MLHNCPRRHLSVAHRRPHINTTHHTYVSHRTTMETILCPAIHRQSFLPANEWAFASSEVLIEEGEDGVLGRGSYGEVRAATWKGIR